MIRTNIAAGSRIVSELSSVVSGHRSGRRERASGAPRDFPGM